MASADNINAAQIQIHQNCQNVTNFYYLTI